MPDPAPHDRTLDPAVLDMLAAYIPQDRRRALVAGVDLPHRAWGTALMADISGFTPLTEALAQALGPKRGAEEVAWHLNRVFDAVIAEVDRYGGSVTGFAGDSITCWFDNQGTENGEPGAEAAAPDSPSTASAARAVRCAFAMQQAMAQVAGVAAGPGHEFTLALKIGLAAGPARRFLAGEPSIQTIDILAGATLDRMAGAEQQARAGEIVVDALTAAYLGAAVRIAEWRTIHEDGRRFAILGSLAVEPAAPCPSDPACPSLDQAGTWLLRPVREQLLAGQGEFLSELRPAAALFLRFGGIDFDEDEQAGAKLDAYLRWVQAIVAEHQGALIQVTVGDKGSYLYAAFGAPLALDDAAGAAVQSAIKLQQSPRAIEAAHHRIANGPLQTVPPVQIGITRGRMRTGAYGGRTRRTYGVLGDDTNLAARLMQRAAPGQILASKRIVEDLAARHTWESIGAVPVKGKAQAVPVYRFCAPCERSATDFTRPSAQFNHPLAGREAELAELAETVSAALDGQSRIVRLEGLAGMGKSHLVAEFSRRAGERGMRPILGACQGATQATPYLPWRQILNALLEIPPWAADRESAAGRMAQVGTWLAQLAPESLPLMPLLSAVLDLPIPESESTAQLTPAVRQGALSALVTHLLRAGAAVQPLLLIFEEAHWMDEASRALVVAVSRELAGAPIVLIVVQRPVAQHEPPLLPELNALPGYRVITLGELDPAAASALVTGQLGAPASPLALSLVRARAQGHPLFTEEIVTSLRETGGLVRGNDGIWDLSPALTGALRDAHALTAAPGGGWQLAPEARLGAIDLGLPDSVYGVVLARLDRLPETHKLTLKVAGVIGRVFSVDTLAQVHPLQPEPRALAAQLADLSADDFVYPERAETGPAYAFKHNVVQETAYETLLYDQRRQLHGAVGAWYENACGGDPDALERLDARRAQEQPIASSYDLLAYHWRQAEDVAREGLYAGLAGEGAAARFANEQAIGHLTRALELASGSDGRRRVRLLFAREAVYDRRGDRQAQAEDLAELSSTLDALAAAAGRKSGEVEQLRAQLALRRAEYARMTSDYPAALEAARQAVDMARQAEHTELELEGRVMAGRVLWQQGSYDEALPRLHAARDMARARGDRRAEAETLAFLGMTYQSLGDLPATREHIVQALDLYKAIGHPEGQARCLGMLGGVDHMLGDYIRARDYYEQALACYHAIGYRRGESVASYFLSGIHLDTGDYLSARDYQERALRIQREIGDRWGAAASLVLLSIIALRLDNGAAAQDYGERALAIQQQIGERRTLGYTYTHLGHALAARGNLAGATEAFDEAVRIQRELGHLAQVMDALGGLVAVDLAAGRTDRALARAGEILDWIDTHGIAGIEYQFDVYLACYHALRAADRHDRARALLAAAHAALQEQASRIQDETLRQRFLEKVKSHRALIAAWAGRSRG